MAAEAFLFGSPGSRFLRWRFLPPPPPVRGRPRLNQSVRNIRPAIVCPPRADAMEDLAASVVKETGAIASLEFGPPEAQQLGAFHLLEHAGLVEVALLAEVTGPFQAELRRLKHPPRLRAPAVVRPHPHDRVAVIFPGRA